MRCTPRLSERPRDMTRTEHLLTILAEECCEVAQRATKALRFGLDEIQPGQELSNAARINGELLDLFAVCEMLGSSGIKCGNFFHSKEVDAIRAKKSKVEDFLAYSSECGTLDEADKDT